MEAADPEEPRDVWHRGALALWRYWGSAIRIKWNSTEMRYRLASSRSRGKVAEDVSKLYPSRNFDSKDGNFHLIFAHDFGWILYRDETGMGLR